MPTLLQSLGTLLSRSGGNRDGALTLHQLLHCIAENFVPTL